MDNVPLNWFDFTLVAIFIFGLIRGRKNGMTKELLPLLKWLAVAVVCGLTYKPLGDLLMPYAGLDALESYLIAYIVVLAVVFFVFSIIKNGVNAKLTGSNIFGDSEYYVGVPAGLARYACMLVVAMSLFNARFFTNAEIQAHDAYVMKNFGGGLYSGNYFPDLHTVQQEVFEKSLSGPYVRQYLSALLIAPCQPGARQSVQTVGPTAKSHS